MRALTRWLFWTFSLAALVGAGVVFFLAFTNWSELKGLNNKLLKSQKDIKTLITAQGGLPTDEAIEAADKLVRDYDADLSKLAREMLAKESKSGFEMFFGETDLTADVTALDLNRYRSRYETERDIVLARTSGKGNVVIPSKENTGFQYFERADLSLDAVILMQKRFWISAAIYSAVENYNSEPLVVKGWKFDTSVGDGEADLPVPVKAIKAVRHKGMYYPPDLTPDDPRYKDTRAVMAPFYFFNYWQVELDLTAPEAAVAGVLRKLLDSKLLLSVTSISVRRAKGEGTDRYTLPNAEITISLLALDYNEKAMESLLPEAPADGGVEAAK